MTAGPRPITLCADDFGIAPGVDRGILELAGRGRLSAVSCMTTAIAWPQDAPRLRDVPAGIELGVHIVLTSPQRPLGLLWADAMLGRLDRAAISTTIERQIDAFESALGRAPDFIDGHLHVHELPRIRGLVAEIWTRRLGRGVWIRNTATSASRIVARPVARARAAVLAALGVGARRLWRRIGATTNADFAGVRDFDERAPYGTLMRAYLQAPVPGLLVMCHPGVPDAVLAAADPVVESRALELAYLASEAFDADLATANARLAPLERA